MSSVGDALIDVVLHGNHEPRTSRARRILGWLANLTNPPIGVRLVSDDGGAFTGFVIVENNKPLAMLALRVGTATPPLHIASAGPAPYRHVHDEPSWRLDDDNLSQ